MSETIKPGRLVWTGEMDAVLIAGAASRRSRMDIAAELGLRLQQVYDRLHHLSGVRGGIRRLTRIYPNAGTAGRARPCVSCGKAFTPAHRQSVRCESCRAVKAKRLDGLKEPKPVAPATRSCRRCKLDFAPDLPNRLVCAACRTPVCAECGGPRSCHDRPGRYCVGCARKLMSVLRHGRPAPDVTPEGPPEPPKPTRALPGTPSKISTLAARHGAGQPLWVDGDARIED